MVVSVLMQPSQGVLSQGTTHWWYHDTVTPHSRAAINLKGVDELISVHHLPRSLGPGQGDGRGATGGTLETAGGGGQIDCMEGNSNYSRTSDIRTLAWQIMTLITNIFDVC